MRSLRSKLHFSELDFLHTYKIDNGCSFLNTQLHFKWLIYSSIERSFQKSVSISIKKIIFWCCFEPIMLLKSWIFSSLHHFIHNILCVGCEMFQMTTLTAKVYGSKRREVLCGRQTGVVCSTSHCCDSATGSWRLVSYFVLFCVLLFVYLFCLPVILHSQCKSLTRLYLDIFLRSICTRRKNSALSFKQKKGTNLNQQLTGGKK